jgi:hypothetical protein
MTDRFTSSALAKRMLLGIASCAAVLSLTGCAELQLWQRPPTLPYQMSVPPNAKLSQVWRAEGVQQYSCLKTSAGSVEWVPGAPRSNLRERSGASVGRQDGWTWSTPDSAMLIGRVVESVQADTGPAYLVVTGSPATSIAAQRTRYIQRVVTAPAEVPTRESCNLAQVGAVVFNNFKAFDYIYEESIAYLPGGCGDLRQSCCQGTFVEGNLPRTIDYCHAGLDCAGGVCVPTTTPPPPPCGDIGQSCCKDVDYLDPNFDSCNNASTTVCFPWLGDHGTCEACGLIGQAACGNGRVCGEGVARNSLCVACGKAGQPCCASGCEGGGVCSAEAGFTCAVCGGEGQPVCGDGTCSGDLHPNLSGERVTCTASCGHTHQLACATQYPVSGGVSWRYRCFAHSKLFAGPGEPIPENCTCVPNTTSDNVEDVSDTSGLCISSNPPAPDRPDPPDCDSRDCSNKQEGAQPRSIRP